MRVTGFVPATPFGLVMLAGSAPLIIGLGLILAGPVGVFLAVFGGGLFVLAALFARRSTSTAAPVQDESLLGRTDLSGALRDTSGSNTEIWHRLGDLVQRPERTAYKALSFFEDTGAGSDAYTELVRMLDGDMALLEVRPATTTDLIWRLISLKGTRISKTVAYQNVPFAWIRKDAGGRVIEANAMARDWGFLPGLEELPLADGEVIQGSVHRVPAKQGMRVFAVLGQRTDIAEDIMFLPLPEREASVTSMPQFIELLPLPVLQLDKAGRVVAANAPAGGVLAADLAPGTAIASVLDGMSVPITERLEDVFETGRSTRAEIARIEQGDTERFLQVSIAPITLDGDVFALMTLADATEMKTLEAQFVQGQKMQAVGQLAGGVAHDFNNLLTAISGHCDLMLMRHEVGDADYSDLQQIHQNSNRAASLVRQLLAFSRKQTLRLKLMRVEDSLVELSHLLNRLIGDQITLRIVRDDDLPTVRGDERQFEQVIMNLVVNARDAMQEGGTIELRARKLVLETEMARDGATLPAGEYILIQVADNGEGIAPTKLKKVFEPFFTTKAPGEGTGLGLSTVYGIVKQSGGFIFVDSQVGVGTTFSVYLRSAGRDVEAVEESVPEGPSLPDLTGDAQILLVEDEAPVRSFASKALKMRGYSVREASTGSAALELLQTTPNYVPDMIVSDVMMPGLDGPNWVAEALKLHPEMRVVFMSGYAEDVFTDERPPIDGAAFLPKPFSLNQLVETVRSTLDANELVS